VLRERAIAVAGQNLHGVWAASLKRAIGPKAGALVATRFWRCNTRSCRCVSFAWGRAAGLGMTPVLLPLSVCAASAVQALPQPPVPPRQAAWPPPRAPLALRRDRCGS